MNYVSALPATSPPNYFQDDKMERLSYLDYRLVEVCSLQSLDRLETFELTNFRLLSIPSCRIPDSDDTV